MLSYILARGGKNDVLFFLKNTHSSPKTNTQFFIPWFLKFCRVFCFQAEWLELSLKMDIPASLLILSRSFLISEKHVTPAEAIHSTLLSLADV